MKRSFHFSRRYYKTIHRVCSSCQVCQAVKGPNQCHASNPDWTSVPDFFKESVAIDKFAMPAVRRGREVYHCLFLFVDHYIGYLVALPARGKGVTGLPAR